MRATGGSLTYVGESLSELCSKMAADLTGNTGEIKVDNTSGVVLDGEI